jgi:hypothetical protein
MHMPRTFYEEFQSRWPKLFRQIQKYVDRLPPAAPGVLPGDAMPSLGEIVDGVIAGSNVGREFSYELAAVIENELGHRPDKENQRDRNLITRYSASHAN